MFFFDRPGTSLSAKGCPRPNVPKPPVFCGFPPLGVRSAKTQNAKKEEVPLAPGNCVFLFSARNLSKGQGAALGQKGLEAQYFAISRPWGSGWRKHKIYKSCPTLGRIFLGGRICPQQMPLAPGNCVFLFLARKFS